MNFADIDPKDSSMGKFIITGLLFALFSLHAISQDHFGALLTNEGVKKILTEAIRDYNNSNDITSFSIPSNKIRSTILKKDVDNIALLKKLKEYMVINLDGNIPYHVNWSPINLNIHFDQKSLMTKFIGTSTTNTTFAVRFKIDRFEVGGRSIELCELKKNKCDNKNSIYGKFENYKISLKRGNAIDALLLFKINIKGGKATLKLNNIYTNLNAPKNATERRYFSDFKMSTTKPRLDVNFKNFIIPPPVLTIDGSDYEIDVKKLSDIILGEREFLSSKLLEYSGEFIADDLSKLLNGTFLEEISKFNTSIISYSSSRSLRFDLPNRTLNELERFRVVADNTRVVLPRPYYELPSNYKLPKVSKNFMEEISGFLNELIYQAKFNLSISSLRSKYEGNLLINSKSFLSLNNKKWTLGTTLKNNKNLKLKNTDVEELVRTGKKFDIAAIISEPITNAVLDMGSDLSIFNRALTKFSNIPGVYIHGVKMYFEAPSSISIVADVGVKLTELKSNGIAGWFKNRVGALLESNYIYFPLEIKATPVITQTRTGYDLNFKLESPLGYKGLKNTYNHPYKDMHSVVESGVIDTIKTDLIPQLKTVPTIKLDNLLEYKGVKLSPVGISVRNTGHLVIMGNIERISLKELGK